jgi:hypothetical protein
MAPPKVPPPVYVELKPANFSMDGDAKDQKDVLQKVMFEAAKKVFESNKDLVTLKLPAGTKVGYSFEWTFSVAKKAGGATGTAKL